MKDLELTLKLRNNQLKARRVQLSMTCAAFARDCGIGQSLYSALETMRKSPISKRPDQVWKPGALRIAAYHGVSPETLWPAALLEVRQPELQTELSAAEALLLANAKIQQVDARTPERLLARREGLEAIDKAVESELNEREHTVVRARFWDGRTFRDVANDLGVSGNRVRQIETEALRKLRKRTGDKSLHEYVGDIGASD